MWNGSLAIPGNRRHCSWADLALSAFVAAVPVVVVGSRSVARTGWASSKAIGATIPSAECRRSRPDWVLETGQPIAQVARDLRIDEGTGGNRVAKERASRGEGRAVRKPTLTEGP